MWNPVRAKKRSVLKGYARTADKYRQSAKAQSAQARLLPAKPVSTFAARGVVFCITMRRPKAPVVSCRTTLEQIAAESVLGAESDSVHGDIWGLPLLAPPYRGSRCFSHCHDRAENVNGRRCPSRAESQGRSHSALAEVGVTRGVTRNCVASSMASPSGVGTAIRNGTTMRVPATGASQTSASCIEVRYLITARLGMWPASG